ncbi:mannitol dehydrogenase family protein [Nocardia panacis]|uniref:Mannitol dehydrogenase family protein n=1 Tax=Nocardia panacis TaxID=2340916 RepID=A0A3A4K1J0_9NOCA|nr:mannitol dehydrogenase family protein [Nocardia panacis]RJO73600.1 mannitol dehydrogenase family protein [Nocardia panacis]
MIPITARTLPDLAGTISVPSYRRSEISTGIVHFGVGGFHRAHQARYLDLLHEAQAAPDWGICGVGVLPADRRMRDALATQDGMYTLCVAAPDGAWTPRVVGSIVEYHWAPEDPETVIERLAAPGTRILTLTITEGGYNCTPEGEFDVDHPAIRADLAPDAMPGTVFGLVAEALARRRARGLRPFTIVSCDNIAGNGRIARASFTAFARLRDPELARWLSAEGAFPNSMVDRITPVTTEPMRAELARRFGVDDSWPVLTEPFTQWVLEDEFPLGRPDLDRVGVQLVGDVAPYELMKLRLLNGSHQALAYLGHLAGYRLVHEAAADPDFAGFLSRYMATEALPTLPPVPGIDLVAYRRELLVRFGNAAIGDTIARLGADASDRIPKWVLPVISDRLAGEGEIACAATVVAGWARYCTGVDEQGEPIEIVDPLRDRLRELAAREEWEPGAFLSERTLFGTLGEQPRFVAAYRKALQSLRTRGARATVRELAAGHPVSP